MMALDVAPIARKAAELLEELETRYPGAELGNALIVVEVLEDGRNIVEHRSLSESTAWAVGLAEIAASSMRAGRPILEDDDRDE